MHNASSSVSSQWDQIYQQVPLCAVPSHFAGISQSPFLLEYLSKVLQLCRRGGRSYETGVGSGYGAVWLSLRGVHAQGIDLSPSIVERARQVNTLMGGHAQFHTGDLFELYSRAQREEWTGFDVIHHQGVLEHFSLPQMRAALAQQVACAKHVVFSVPSVYYPFEPEFGDERLLPLETWQEILQPFEVEELRLYGDPQHGAREQVLCVLRGQEVSDSLRSLMKVVAEPYPAGVSAIVHTRNEARHIQACLESLQGWTDEILVCDMESEDNTVELARPLATRILHHPLIPNFDRARNVSALSASFRWVFYLDADERVPPRLGAALRHLIAGQDLIANQGADHAEPVSPPFAALLIPFRHHFAGHWMRSLYPGYTAPRLLKNGRFVFNARLHSGAQVDGLVSRFPAEDPDLALVHYSFDSLSHYLDKLNRYTDGEALNLHRDGAPFHWSHAARDFVRDFQAYYEGAEARADGVHGFLYSFLSGFYRFQQHAKLYERRFHAGHLRAEEQAVPTSLEEMLEFMLRVARDKPLPAPAPILISSSSTLRPLLQEPSDQEPAVGEVLASTDFSPAENFAQAQTSLQPLNPRQDSIKPGGSGSQTLPSLRAPLVWSGPLLDPSGYGEESRSFVFGLDEIGVPLCAQVLPWSHDVVDMPTPARARLEELMQVPVAPGFTQVIHTLAPQMRRHPQAGLTIGRTMFETDRLPADWVRACHSLDAIWVPSEFHRQSFRGAGLSDEKLFVVPEGLDPAEYESASSDVALSTAIASLPASERTLLDAIRTEQADGRFVFLSVFDWTRHKGWDVLLRGFLRAFEGRSDVTLLLRVWSTLGLGAEGIRAQASEFIASEIGHNLLADGQVRFLPHRLTRPGLCALYSTCDAFVLPSRGEGWGRPYMEAMACGKPTIGTNWSGNTAFMHQENSFLLPCTVRDVPPIGWAELPSYRGHRWAEPDEGALIDTLRQVSEDRERSRAVGARAREEMLARYDRRVVAQIALEALQKAEQYLSPRRAHQAISLPAVPGALDSPNQDSPLQESLHEDNALSGQPVNDSADLRASDVTNSSTFHSSTPLASLEPIALRWEGAFFNWHSLGHVNRELCLALLALSADLATNTDLALNEGLTSNSDVSISSSLSTGDEASDVLLPPPDGAYGSGSAEAGTVTPAIELCVVPIEAPEFAPDVDPRFGALARRSFAPLSRPAQIHLRHFFPPRFEAPAEGHFVLIQPWEYGYLPTEWIEPILTRVDQVWCHTEYVRRVYLDSGIPASKLRMVPLGIDPSVFRADGPPYVFTDEPGAEALMDKSDRTERETFVFLYTGGSIHRKGIDILLEAFRRAFTRLDDVCLVIKDTGTGTVYRDAHSREEILALSRDPHHPPVVYLDADLSASQLAGVFRMADVLVQPYRGEGFCLPVLEAMACGTPVIVPSGGPTDDFVDETVGWRLEAARLPFHVDKSGHGRVGSFECVGPTWMFELDPDVLARELRRLVSDRAEVRRRGEVATRRAHGSWTWRHAAGHALRALQELASKELVSEELISEEPASPLLPMRTKESTNSVNGLETKQLPESVSLGHSNSPEHEINEDMAQEPLLPAVEGKPSLSLCLIVRDEERVLEECLASATHWFDEIIVVDTGSTDRTVAIAQQFGARVFHFPWCDDFSAARNESLRHARGDWIFWMDADDTLPAHCGAQLRDLIWRAEDRVTGFIAQVHIPAAPGEVGFTIVDHVKLFRNLPGLRFEGRIHEQILEPLHRMGGRIERSAVHVVHSGYDYSPAGQQKKRARDLTILEKDLAERPNHPFVLFNIGMTAYHLKEFPKAIEALEACLARSRPQESTVRKVYAMLAGCHLERKEIAAAVQRIEQGLELYPLDPELLFRAGVIFREAGDLARASQSYLTLLSRRETGHVDSIDVTMTGFKAHHNLALIYHDMGQNALAEEQFRAALRDYSEFVPSWLGLADLYLRQGRYDEVHAICDQLQTKAPEEAQKLRAAVDNRPVVGRQ
jgi:glycosyltransferase involved in cell wall biosynthesis